MDVEPTVASIMSTEICSVPSTAGVTEAARLMVDRAFSGLPVVDGGRLVGIVTEADIISRQMDVDPPAFGTFLDAVFRFPWDHSDEELRRVLATSVADLMTDEVVTVRPDAPISELASLMFKRKVNPVPVVSSKGLLVGIVSRTDVIRMLLRGEDAAAETSTP